MADTVTGVPPLNDLVVKIRDKYPKVYDNIDDATLTKQVLAKYPMYSPLAAPSVDKALGIDDKTAQHRPAPPKELAPSTGIERVGDRIRSNVEMIPKTVDSVTAEGKQKSGRPLNADDKELLGDAHRQAEGSRHMVSGGATTPLGKAAAAVTIVPRTVYEQGKEYVHDPSKFFGDLVTLLPELSEMHLAPPNKVYNPNGAAAPRPSLLDTETQAKYTQALDKANTEYQADAKDYHTKVTKAFDEAKREHTEATAKYDAEAKTAADKARAANDTARAEWIEKSRAYEKARTEAEANTQKAKTLAQSAKSKVKELFGNLKETYRAGKASLDQRWSGEHGWNKAMEGTKIDPKLAFDTIEKAKVNSLRGAPGSLPVLNNLLKEMGIQDFIENEDGTMTAVPGKNELPVETARTHYSAIGEKLGQTNALGMSDLPGNIRHALQEVQNALDQTIVKAAEAKSTPERNLAAEYRTLKNDEHTFRTDWTDKRSPLAIAMGKLDANYLEPLITGRGNEFIARQLARYKQFGAKPNLVTDALRDLTEAKTAAKTKIKVPPEPGPEPAPVYASEPGPRPGLPKKTVPDTQPELKPVEKPSASVPKAGRMSRAAAKVIGKLGGAFLGSLLKRPMTGWAAGGELAPMLLDRIVGTKQMPGIEPVTVADMVELEPVEKAGIRNGITDRLIQAAEKGESLPPLQKFKDVLTPEQMQKVMQAAMKGKVQSSVQ